MALDAPSSLIIVRSADSSELSAEYIDGQFISVRRLEVIIFEEVIEESSKFFGNIFFIFMNFG